MGIARPEGDPGAVGHLDLGLAPDDDERFLLLGVGEGSRGAHPEAGNLGTVPGFRKGQVEGLGSTVDHLVGIERVGFETFENGV